MRALQQASDESKRGFLCAALATVFREILAVMERRKSSISRILIFITAFIFYPSNRSISDFAVLSVWFQVLLSIVANTL